MDVVLEIVYYKPGCPQLSLKKNPNQAQNPNKNNKKPQVFTVGLG